MRTEKADFSLSSELNRRKFIAGIAKTAGAALLLGNATLSKAGSFFSVSDDWTIGQVMDLFISQVAGAPFKSTVDTLKTGSRDTKVTGIVTTMFATIKVIQQAIDLGANFIIAHEPTFYNHADETDWLTNDDVYQYKRDLLNKHHIAVWRNHDYIHHLVPDGVLTGVLARLNWEKYYNPEEPFVLNIPPVALKQLITYAKEKLNIQAVRYIGDLSQSCQKVLLIPGAAGGHTHIPALLKYKPDVLLCGEIEEWETAEYVRDARAKGNKFSLVVLGHIASEEPGSDFMLNWLKKRIPAVKVTHIPSGNSLSFL